MNTRSICWTIGLAMSGLTIGTAAEMTAAQDHQRMMDALHIASIPSGPRSGCPETYDEATANPYPVLPDPLTMKNGRKVTTAAEWKARRAETLEDFEREVYGRRPKNIPKVTWTVTSTTDSTSGDIPTVVKQLVGHVDNSAIPSITVDIQATLTTPKTAAGPVPVMLIFSGGGFGPAPGAPAAAPARGPVVPPTPCDNPTAKAYFAANPNGPPPAPAAARGAGATLGPGRGADGTPPAPCSTGPCPRLLARGQAIDQGGFRVGTHQVAYGDVREVRKAGMRPGAMKDLLGPWSWSPIVGLTAAAPALRRRSMVSLIDT